MFSGSVTDEKEDRYDLVLGFTGLAINSFTFAIAPLFVGFYFDFNNSSWLNPMIFYLLHLLLVFYWRFRIVMYYDQKDVELAEELELEEKNLNAKPSLSNVSFSSNNALMGGGGYS